MNKMRMATKIQTIKNKPYRNSEDKIKTTELRNSIQVFRNRLKQAAKQISKFEDKLSGNTECEEQKLKTIIKNSKQIQSHLWGTFKPINIHICIIGAL